MEPLTPIMPPVGLKTIVRSSTAMTLIWTDTTLGRSQRVTDNRFYTVRYNPKFLRKYKLVNCSELILNVDDLQPDQEYEFSVKVSKGMRQSTWSLSVFNKTREAGMITCNYLLHIFQPFGLSPLIVFCINFHIVFTAVVIK